LSAILLLILLDFHQIWLISNYLSPIELQILLDFYQIWLISNCLSSIELLILLDFYQIWLISNYLSAIWLLILLDFYQIWLISNNATFTDQEPILSECQNQSRNSSPLCYFSCLPESMTSGNMKLMINVRQKKLTPVISCHMVIQHSHLAFLQYTANMECAMVLKSWHNVNRPKFLFRYSPPDFTIHPTLLSTTMCADCTYTAWIVSLSTSKIHFF